MRGHHDLIEMRRKGFIPAYGVEVETDAKSSGWPEQWPQLHAWIGVHSPMAYVHIGPDERLGLLDLRWAVGLEVDRVPASGVSLQPADPARRA